MEENNKINIDGKNKEIKFVEVHEQEKYLKIFFTDFTYVNFEKIKIINKGDGFLWN